MVTHARTNGYAGKILRVDLSRRLLSEEELDLGLMKSLIGGGGYAINILLNEVLPTCNPYHPDNRLVFMTGPLTGTVPSGTKTTASTRSPLTLILGETTFGGFWGSELKLAGYDGVIVQGKAEKPVYLWISNYETEIRDASHLYGMGTYDTCRAIKLGDGKVRVICIGPSGERLVRIAALITDDERVGGRTGVGAVMGSKNLKAIAVRGRRRVDIADEAKVRKLSKEFFEIIKNSTRAKGLTLDGTAGGVEPFEALGNLPIKNWTKGTFENAEKISGTTITRTLLTRRTTCFACPISCGRQVKVKGPYAFVGRGPEYETVAALGSLCLNDNLESIAKANKLCNQYGIDTISAGCVIAFAMECFEKGLITKRDTEGIDLSWGNYESILKITELICKREGFGATLGEGVRIATQKIGKGAEKCAMHVKGLEIPMHNPRVFKSMGLAYATSNRGACHLQGMPMMVERGILLPEFGFDHKLDGFSIKGKPYLTKVHQDLCTAIDALGICKFAVIGVIPITFLARLYSTVTGWDVSHHDLLKLGERIWNLKRAFNVKMGISRKYDTLPKRFLEETVNEGLAKGQIVELEPMLNEYYKLRGWDEQGKPTKVN